MDEEEDYVRYIYEILVSNLENNIKFLRESNRVLVTDSEKILERSTWFIGSVVVGLMLLKFPDNIYITVSNIIIISVILIILSTIFFQFIKIYNIYKNGISQHKENLLPQMGYKHLLDEKVNLSEINDETPNDFLHDIIHDLENQIVNPGLASNELLAKQLTEMRRYSGMLIIFSIICYFLIALNLAIFTFTTILY